MLWADKHRPRDFGDLDYHLERGQELKNLTKDGDFPHLLFYGPLGAGKKTRIMCLLRELYGPTVDRLKIETMHFTTPSNKKLEISTVGSNCHIEVNPSDVGIYDRVVIMDLIKNVAQTQQLNINAQREFKVILLTDVENLTKDAQHALRRTMEKYMETCRIILCTTSLSRVIAPIRSRCLCVRVPAPSTEQIVDILQKVSKREDLTLPPKFAQTIALSCERNLRRALLMLESSKVRQYPFSDDQKVIEPDWQVFIHNLAGKIVTEQSVRKLAEIRQDLYKLITLGIPCDIIFMNLVKELVAKCDSELAANIVQQAAIYEHRMVQGNKEIFHLEAFVAKTMCLYQNMVLDLLGDF